MAYASVISSLRSQRQAAERSLEYWTDHKRASQDELANAEEKILSAENELVEIDAAILKLESSGG